jgi:MFS family permease
MFSNLEVNSSNWYILLCLLGLGLGSGTFNTPNSSALMGSVSVQQRAITSGIMATTRNIGMSVGVALSTALFTYFQQQYAGMGTQDEIFVMSYHKVIYVSVVIAAIGIPICLIRANRLADGATEVTPESVAAG